MNKLTTLTAAALVMSAPGIVHAEITAGVTGGLFRQSSSQVEINTKGLTVGVSLLSKFKIEASIESLAVNGDEVLNCSLCSSEGRALGFSLQYSFVEASVLQPFVLVAITSEHYLLANTDREERYVRSELGVGVAVKLSSQLQIVGDARVGQRSVVKGEVGSPGFIDPPYRLFQDGERSESLRIGAQIRF